MSIIDPQINIKLYTPLDCTLENLSKLSHPDQKLLLKALKSEQDRKRLIVFLNALQAVNKT
jgi:hypothetical protein